MKKMILATALMAIAGSTAQAASSAKVTELNCDRIGLMGYFPKLAYNQSNINAKDPNRIDLTVQLFGEEVALRTDGDLREYGMTSIPGVRFKARALGEDLSFDLLFPHNIRTGKNVVVANAVQVTPFGMGMLPSVAGVGSFRCEVVIEE